MTDSELAALADGVLSRHRRTRVEAAITASPELARRLAVQVRVAAAIRDAAARIEAPGSLRATLADLFEDAGNPDRLPRP